MATPKILVIDDDPVTCRLLETYLQMENYITASATNVDHNSIFTLLEKELPDLLLMDCHLGAKETLEYVPLIREKKQWKKLPIIMTSAIDYTQTSLKVGANDFILKPFDWDELTNRIETIRNSISYQEA